MTPRWYRTESLLPIVVVVLTSVALCSFILAQPQEKIGGVHHTSRKRIDGRRSWNHQEILNVIQNVDLTSSLQTPTSSFGLSVPANVVTLPAFLERTHFSENSLSPCLATGNSRFGVSSWRFLITDQKWACDTTTTGGIAHLESGSVEGERSQFLQYQVAVAHTTQHDHSLSHAHHHHNNNIWKRLRDDFSFKGYGISIYKSLMAFNKAGIAFRIPLLNHWDWWDSNPALPSIGLMLCLYYPFNVSVGMTSSMRMDVLKCWLIKSVLLVQAAILQFLHHLLSASWIFISFLLYPLQRKWRPAPWHLDQRAAQAAAQSKEASAWYQSEIQERLGTTFWYRWTPAAGFDSRVSVWHLYMPTLEVYSQVLTGSKEGLLGPWWKSHFASLGLDSAFSNSVFSATSVLSLSGLRFQRGRVNGRMSDRPVEEDTLTIPPISANTAKDKAPSRSSDIDFKTTKTTLSTILQDDREKYKDDDEHEHSMSSRLKVMRGGNTTVAATECTTSNI
jgi:hypothetical protein